ncbi:TrbC/VirB2 family protein [Paraburkholderia tagetis]|uniref:TrbC/VirB2 family protein n=1 Tax=Paraburkholderia tagetis TaxID=2913261 RepID=A0A9X1RTY1_9BURK|nr:TrbC/VirB2 family protein [Paraburkholderia tagetis]MCG5077248.1 TrbC/VirB2 family protein [Paraburkholderia tagetis]
MKQYLASFIQNATRRARTACSRLFSRRELRTTLIAAALSAIAPVASATSTDLSDLGPATDAICLISNYISGPWLFCIGLVVMIIAFIAIANSESTLGKVLGSVFVGVGLAACAIPVLKDHFKISYVCT